MKKNNTTRILGRVSVIICMLALLAALCVGVSAHNFRDVNEYDEAIDLLSSIEVIKGYSNTSFGPNDNVTRWQMALLISKLRTGRVETSVWESTSSSTTFTDVKPQSHYPAAIKYAHNNGIIIGRSNEIFAPDDNITVQDGITMCVRALGYPKSQYDSGYPNSYISKGKELGLFEGLYNLSYTATLTRGQTAQMLYNALFAPTYDSRTGSSSGATFADDAFGFVDSNIVLAATEDMRFDTNVKYASSGMYTFAIINDYGRLGDSFELDASMFDFDDANEALGTMYSIRATGDYETILSLDLVSKVLPDSKTQLLSISSTSNLTMGGISYKPVSQRSYALETGKTPSNKEILIYALNDDVISKQYTSGKLLSVSNMQGTTGYYTMRAFDDNGDGYADRAFYKAYSFGQYKADSSGRLSIANNNTASQIKITGKTVNDGDYVLFSFDSQTKTLEIYKVLTTFEGQIGSGYNSSNSTITVGTTTYQVGSNDVRGAAVNTVAKDITTLTSASTRKLSGYCDADKKIIFVCTLQAEEVSLSGNYYGYDLAMVLDFKLIQAAEQTYNSGYQQGYYQSYNYYPAVQLSTTNTISNSGGGNWYILNAVDGVTVTTSNYYQVLKKGAIIQFAQQGTKTLMEVGSSTYAYYPVVNLTDCSSKSSYTSSGTTTTLCVDDVSGTKVLRMISANGLYEGPSYAISSSTMLYIYDGYQTVTPYTYEQLITDDWKYDAENLSTYNGHAIQNSYISFYVIAASYNPYYGQTTNQTYSASAIFIRPFDFSTYAMSSSAFNGIVYIPKSSIDYPYPNGTALAYNAFDIKSGSQGTFLLASSKGRLTAEGYYKVLNNYITDITPVTSSISNTTMNLLISPSITSVQTSSSTTASNKYGIFQIGTTAYYPSYDNIRIYQTNATTQSYLSSPMTVIETYITNADGTKSVSPQFELILNMLATRQLTIKAIYMESTTNMYGSSYYNGPFYIII